MTYDEARAIADGGKAVVVSYAGGRKRYAWFILESPTGIVSVRLFHTTIARFYPDGRITLNTGGYHTRTTVDALNCLVSRRGVVWTERRLGLVYCPYNGESIPFVDGMEVAA